MGDFVDRVVATRDLLASAIGSLGVVAVGTNQAAKKLLDCLNMPAFPVQHLDDWEAQDLALTVLSTTCDIAQMYVDELAAQRHTVVPSPEAGHCLFMVMVSCC